MKTSTIILAGISMTMVVTIGWLATPYVLADRVMPGIRLGEHSLGGVKSEDLEGVLAEYEKELLSKSVTLQLRDQEITHTLGELGFRLDKKETTKSIKSGSNKVYLPISYQIPATLELDEDIATTLLREEFSDKLSFPKNASLTLNSAGQLELVSSESGEQIDVVTLEQAISEQASYEDIKPIELTVIKAAADVQDNEVSKAEDVAEIILRGGMNLVHADQSFSMQPFTIRRLLEFVDREDPEEEGNKILGVQLNPEGLTEYLNNTIVPAVNRSPVNARFEFKDSRVSQFAVPSNGQTLDVEQTVSDINKSLRDSMTETTLAVEVTEPTIQTNDDIEEMGITTLLASGESDFVGSPTNRVHNIRVGADKYHGLLLSPGQEFSFNEFLGPVTGEAGFKPELVIKGNQTIPEFGGGICQVSTTIFRAAVNSGLEITQRRNHSYAVSYYGTPGFDSTIYPPYTDLRFLNNTPGYILVQVKIVGTKITFELWGTDDGREVVVTKPYIYDRQPNGAMKATVKQTVTKDGEVVLQDTFYSNYKSPELFPKSLAADGAKPSKE